MDIFNFYRVRIQKNRDESVLEVQFTNPRNTENQDADITRSFNGKEMAFAAYESLDLSRWFCCSDKQQELMLAFVDYFKVVFNCKLFYLRITLRDTDNIDIYFKDPFFKRATCLSIGFGAVTENEMTGFFDHFRVETKRFACYPGRAYQYDKPISLDSLDISEAQWMTRSNLLNLNCKQVDIRKSYFKSADFNAFLISWMMTDNHKLEHLCIIGKADEDFLDINKTMEGIECDAGTQKRHALSS